MYNIYVYICICILKGSPPPTAANFGEVAGVLAACGSGRDSVNLLSP